MQLRTYTCGYGTAARQLLRDTGHEIEEHVLRTRHEADTFKDKHKIATTPLIYIDGKKIGGYTDLKRHLKAQKPKKKGFGRR